jgi:hypothetical protein
MIYHRFNTLTAYLDYLKGANHKSTCLDLVDLSSHGGTTFCVVATALIAPERLAVCHEVIYDKPIDRIAASRKRVAKTAKETTKMERTLWEEFNKREELLVKEGIKFTRGVLTTECPAVLR